VKVENLRLVKICLELDNYSSFPLLRMNTIGYMLFVGIRYRLVVGVSCVGGLDGKLYCPLQVE
jgi:hypothetical protein